MKIIYSRTNEEEISAMQINETISKMAVSSINLVETFTNKLA